MIPRRSGDRMKTGRRDAINEEWNRAPFVKAYHALRGVSMIVAATVVAEIGDMNRFQSPKS